MRASPSSGIFRGRIPEAFGICPWQRQLVDGLLGADLIGFHIQSHCNNFLETVDRVVESRVDWEHFSALRQDHRTMVRPFPISVAFTDDDVAKTAIMASTTSNVPLCCAVWAWRRRSWELVSIALTTPREFWSVSWRSNASSKSTQAIRENSHSWRSERPVVPISSAITICEAEVEAEAERINWRFQGGKWKPIVFLKRSHSHQEIEPYYRAADLCLVTSLHDGMNLVAKEFLAARQDERGVLILSQFTGAARELRDALLVNPYDIDQTAEAIRAALEMEPEDKQLRVHRMRRVIKEHNIYRWAGNLVTELCEVRLDAPEDVHEKFRANASVA